MNENHDVDVRLNEIVRMRDGVNLSADLYLPRASRPFPTDGSDTDWTAELVDVSRTGYAMNLCDGIIRARYRDSFTDPSLLEPGRVYEYTVDVGATANFFRKGHRIRIEISLSNFPRYVCFRHCSKKCTPWKIKKYSLPAPAG